MKQIRKYKPVIAAWFITCFVSAFTVKTFHHLEAHGNEFACESHATATLNLHAAGEDACCPICDFFFSPFHDQTFQPVASACKYLTDVLSTPVKDVPVQTVSFLYSLRAPPL